MKKDSIKQINNGSITTPRGFLAGAVSAGIKKKTVLDLGIVYSEVKCTACGMFTKNRIKAFPVVFSENNLKKGSAQLIVANSGCANACTGEEGKKAVWTMAHSAASRFNIADQDVIVASTGVIGVQLPLDKVEKGIKNINATADGGHDFAKAILTTDTLPKEIALSVGDGEYTIAGVAKGSGMIHPDMATMFCFITTDANVELSYLQGSLKSSVNKTFNMITVDGDTSTSDIVAVLANGKSGNKLINSKNRQMFQEALDQICTYLAKFIARDGEGATKLIEVMIDRAASLKEARIAARVIAGSSLVKSAVHGNDPNWGRIAAAIGRSGTEVKEESLDIYIYDICVLKNGIPQEYDAESLSKIMGQSDNVLFKVCLNSGKYSSTSWGCDLSEEYVTINSDYTT